MALSYVGGNEGNGTGATYAISLTALTGGSGAAAQAGDLVIVVSGWAATANGDPGVSSPGDYNEIIDIAGNDTRDANLSVSWKIMGSTPDTSVTVRGFNNAANGGATVVHVWRGADPTTPIDTASTSATGNNSSNGNSPSITPVTAGAVILSCVVCTGDATPQAKTPPATYINDVCAQGPGSTMGAIACIASLLWDDSGPEDPGAWSGGETSTSDSWAAASVVIRPFVITGPTLLSATITDAGRDYENRNQDITLVFSEAMYNSPAVAVGDPIPGLTAFWESFDTVPLTYKSGSGTDTWVVNMDREQRSGGSLSPLFINYAQSTGSILSIADDTELEDNPASGDWQVVNDLTTKIREVLRNKDNALLNAVEVWYSFHTVAAGDPAAADWMAREQKGSTTTSADGVFDVAFTGTTSPGSDIYLTIFQPAGDVTETLIWRVTVR